MAVYKYGDITAPELPASSLPYAQIYKKGNGWRVFFSSKPFIAADISSDDSISLMGHYGCYTAAVVDNEATVKLYDFVEEKGRGWGVATGYEDLSNTFVVYGGEEGKTYYLAGSLQEINWCNHDIMWMNSTVVQQSFGDPVLVKETFPIKVFTEFLLAGLEVGSVLLLPDSGGGS